MASQELVNKVKGFDRQILTDQKNGGNLAREEGTLQAYTHCVITAIHVENDPEYGLKLSKRVKNMINAWAKSFGYADIFALEKRAVEVKSKVNPIEYYYQILYCEHVRRSPSWWSDLTCRTMFQVKADCRCCC